MSEWDAVVVGGGPAGAATAARLAGAGLRVLVLDRADFPRRKPCGECVNPAGVSALRALGAWDRVAALNPEPLRGWTIHAQDGEHFTGSFPADSAGIALPREALDLALLEHAADRGAEVRTGTRAVDVVRAADGVAGVRLADGEIVSARVVVGADGLRSVVARRLGLLRRPPRLRKVAFTAHLEPVTGPVPAMGELRTSARGCLGIAMVGSGLANVTVVAAEREAAAIGGDAAEYFDRSVARYGFAGRRVDEVLATGPFDFPMRCVVADGALLVGDAAGYYDPFTGQGIFRALRGAELAAAALAGAPQGRPSRAALRGYARGYREAFAGGERLQHVVEAFVARPRWLGWAAGRLARHPELGDALIRAAGDVAPPGTLLRPRLLLQLAT